MKNHPMKFVALTTQGVPKDMVRTEGGDRKVRLVFYTVRSSQLGRRIYNYLHLALDLADGVQRS